jgi:hypothetical protein
VMQQLENPPLRGSTDAAHDGLILRDGFLWAADPPAAGLIVHVDRTLPDVRAPWTGQNHKIIKRKNGK